MMKPSLFKYRQQQFQHQQKQVHRELDKRMMPARSTSGLRDPFVVTKTTLNPKRTTVVKNSRRGPKSLTVEAGGHRFTTVNQDTTPATSNLIDAIRASPNLDDVEVNDDSHVGGTFSRPPANPSETGAIESGEPAPVRSQLALGNENSFSDEVRSIDLNKDFHSSRISATGAGVRTQGGATARGRSLLTGVEGVAAAIKGSTETAYGRELQAQQTLEPTRSSLKQKVQVMPDDGVNEIMPLRVLAYERGVKDGGENIPMIAIDFPHIHANNLRTSLTSGGSSSQAAGAVLLFQPNTFKQQPPPQQFKMGHAQGHYLSPKMPQDFSLQGQKITKPTMQKVKSGTSSRAAQPTPATVVMAVSGPEPSHQATSSVRNLNPVMKNQSLPKLIPDRQQSFSDKAATAARASKALGLRSMDANSGLGNARIDESKDYAEASITSKDKAGPEEAGARSRRPGARLLESSTEERVALFNEMKMMAHMARKGGLASPTPESGEPRVTTNPDMLANIEFSFQRGKDTVQMLSGSSKGQERQHVMLSSSPSRSQRKKATMGRGSLTQDVMQKTPQQTGAIYFSEDEQLTRHESNLENDRFVTNLLTKFGANNGGAPSGGVSDPQLKSHHFRTRSTYNADALKQPRLSQQTTGLFDPSVPNRLVRPKPIGVLVNKHRRVISRDGARGGKARNRLAGSLFSGDDAVQSPVISADYANETWGGLEKVRSAVMPEAEVRSELAPDAERTIQSSSGLYSTAERNYRNCQRYTNDRLMKNQGLIYKQMTLDMLSQHKRHYERVALKGGISPPRKQEQKKERTSDEKKESNVVKNRDENLELNKIQEHPTATITSSIPNTSRGAQSGRGQLNKHRFRREFLDDTMRNFKQLSLKAYDRPVDHVSARVRGIDNYAFALSTHRPQPASKQMITILKNEMDNRDHSDKPPSSVLFPVASADKEELDDAIAQRAARQGATYYRLGGGLRKTSLPLAGYAKSGVEIGPATNIAGLTMDSRLSKPSPAATGNATPLSLQERTRHVRGPKDSLGPANELFGDSDTLQPRISGGATTGPRKRERLSQISQPSQEKYKFTTPEESREDQISGKLGQRKATQPEVTVFLTCPNDYEDIRDSDLNKLIKDQVATIPAERTKRFKPASRLVHKAQNASPVKAEKPKKQSTATKMEKPARRRVAAPQTQVESPPVIHTPQRHDSPSMSPEERSKVIAEFEKGRQLVYNRLRAEEEFRYEAIDKHTSAVSEINEELQHVHRELVKRSDISLKNRKVKEGGGNSAAALFGLSQKLKIMNQKVQRLVIASDEFPHIELDTPTSIELTPQLNRLYYRVEIKGAQSPVKVSIEYANGSGKKTNLEVFVSTTAKEPSMLDNEMSFFQQQCFYLHAHKIGSTKPDAISAQIENSKQSKAAKEYKAMQAELSNVRDPKFADQYLYMCFASESGCSFTISLDPVASRATANQLKLAAFKVARERQIRDIEKTLFTTAEPFYCEMLEMVEKQARQIAERSAFTKANYKELYFKDEIQVAEKFLEHDTRMIEASIRKQEMDKEDHKRRAFGLIRWQLISQIKLDMIDKNIERVRRIVASGKLIQNIKTYFMLKHIRAVFSQVKHERKLRFAISFFIHYYRKVFVKKLQTRGATAGERIRKQITNVFTASAPALESCATSRAYEIMSSFLPQVCLFGVLAEKFRRCKDTIENVQKMMRARLERDKFRQKAMRCEVFEIYAKDMIKSLAKNTKNKKAGELSKLLMLMIKKPNTPEKKDTEESSRLGTEESHRSKMEQKSSAEFILRMHWRRQRLASRIAYMHWYINLELTEKMRLSGDLTSEEDVEGSGRHEKKPVYEPHFGFITEKVRDYQRTLPKLEEGLKAYDKFLEPPAKDLSLVEEKDRSKSRAASSHLSGATAKSGKSKKSTSNSRTRKKKVKAKETVEHPTGCKGSLPLFQMLNAGDIKQRNLMKKLVIRAAKIQDTEIEDFIELLVANPLY